WIASRPAAHAAKAAVQNLLASSHAPKGYDPTKHKWLMCIDVERCIGCGLCVDACKRENHVPEASSFFRTWIERYVIKVPAAGGNDARGDVLVDSPNGGRDGFPPSAVPREEILKSFFVPKLCNLCEHSPCAQACPVGATFDSPDGAVLVDSTYCIGCGFCIPAGAEVCPTQARISGDQKTPVENDPAQEFVRKNKVFTLKPHLGTEPRVLYANIDKEVR